MRHRKKFNHLGRKSAHRKALLSNLAISLILHKRIVTTLAKAKELRKYVEPLATKSKADTTHSRRTIFSYLQNKYAIKELFGEIAPRIADRPGGYTRILKLGPRQGDSAEMALIEFVDFNEFGYTQAKAGSQRRRRSRRGSAGSGQKPASNEPVAVAEAPAGVALPPEPDGFAEASTGVIPEPEPATINLPLPEGSTEDSFPSAIEPEGSADAETLPDANKGA